MVVQWNIVDKTKSWNSGKVMVEQWGGTVEQCWWNSCGGTVQQCWWNTDSGKVKQRWWKSVGGTMKT